MKFSFGYLIVQAAEKSTYTNRERQTEREKFVVVAIAHITYYIAYHHELLSLQKASSVEREVRYK